MGIKFPDRNKTVLGNSQLELEADTGEAFLVKDIMIANPANYNAVVKVKNTTIGMFRVSGVVGNNLQFPAQDEENASLFGWLIDQGLFAPVPVPEGEKLIIQNVAQAGAVQAITYDVVDPGDITEDMMNHPGAPNYQFINYGQPASGPGDGDTLIDTQISPAELPAFPYEGDVPAGKEIIVKGVLFGDYAETTGTDANEQATQYLKLVKEREVLFDEDRNGLLYYVAALTSDGTQYAGGQSVGGRYSSVDNRLPLILEEPLVFNAGQELGIYVTTSVEKGTAMFAAEDVEVGLIEEVREAG